MARSLNKKRGLNLPADLISRIGGDDFDTSAWQKSHNVGGKRKSRKETRKELRQSKRQRRSPAPSKNLNSREPTEMSEGSRRQAKPPKPFKSAGLEPPARKPKSVNVSKPFQSAHELELRAREEEDARYYAKKLGMKSMKLKDEDDGLGDILGDLDFDEFPGSQDSANASGSSGESSDSDLALEFDEDEMTAEQTMAKLAALKAERANRNTIQDSKPGPKEELRIVRADDLGASDDSLSEIDSACEESDFDAQSSTEEMTAEETMAKLAALKESKRATGSSQKGKLPLEEDDSLSDSDFEDEESESDGENMTAKETMEKLAALKGLKASQKQPGDDDDHLSDSDFDGTDESDDENLTAEETMQRLAALKNKANPRQVVASHSDPDSVADDDDDSESESEDDNNPYLPPSRRGQTETGATTRTAQTDAPESEAAVKMRRVFKSALNRLTESTFNHVVNEIELSFSRNSLAEASEILTKQLLENISGSQSQQHSMFVVYAGVVAALYRSVGTNFAAQFVQTIVEEVIKATESVINYLTLLVECYSLHVVSSRLLYDMLKRILQNITDAESQSSVEQVLVITRNGGSQLRADDPLALKEVILLLQQRISELGGTSELPARMRFLVDTVVALKNNRQKPVSELVVALRHRLRKQLQSGSSHSAKEPLQVGLEDIMDTQSKGRWWLVGASWKGKKQRQESELPTLDADGSFESGAPDWLQLAKQQRLNTDVRRAVFVALMGAEDYLDACLRIDKLGLKNKQERDIPHVILHCLGQEPIYNPYYALVAAKQCTRHSTRKTFQFRLFDWLDSEPRGNVQLAMHYGRFYASLLMQKVLGLEILKTADFLGASDDVLVFLEILLVTLYRDLGKQAEKDARRHLQQGLGRVDVRLERDGRELTLLVSKCKDEKVLRGLQLMTKAVVGSEAIRSERDKDRILWSAQLVSDLAEEIVKRGGLEEPL